MKNRDVHREHQAWHLNMIIIKDSIIWILKVTVAGSSLSFIFFLYWIEEWRADSISVHLCFFFFLKHPILEYRFLTCANLRDAMNT